MIEQGKIDEALTHYEQAVRALPDRRGLSCVAWRLRWLAQAGTIEPSPSGARPFGWPPTIWQARLGLADALLAGGDAGEAVAQCREILKQEPGAIEAIVILGAALAAEGQVEEAIPYLERALELDPRNARAHFHLGLALYDRGQSQSAIAHLNEAIRLQPDNVPMLWQTAWILATSPDPSVRDGARAVELATRAIQLSKGQEVRAFDALAAALAETEEFSAAVDAAEQASTMALAARRRRVGRRHRAADAPLPPGLAVSPAGDRRRPGTHRRERRSKCLVKNADCRIRLLHAFDWLRTATE